MWKRLKQLGSEFMPFNYENNKEAYLVSLYNANGERNSIKLTDFVDGVLPDTFVADKLHTPDGSSRWYPTPNVYENVESTRTDTTTEEFQSGLTVRIQNGVQTFMGNLIQVDESLASRILSNGCSDFGVYEIDKDGSLRGEMSADGSELYPIKINKGSLDSYSVPEVEGTSVQRVMVTFQFDGTVSEIKLMKIANTQIESNMLQIASLIDGVLTQNETTPSTNTNLYVDFNVVYGGTFGSPIPIQGQTDVASWVLVDSSFSPVTISTILESGKGKYDFAITGVTPPETLELTYLPSASSKSDDQEFESNTFTISLT